MTPLGTTVSDELKSCDVAVRHSKIVLEFPIAIPYAANAKTTFLLTKNGVLVLFVGSHQRLNVSSEVGDGTVFGNVI
jgi:hypothetical protein